MFCLLQFKGMSESAKKHLRRMEVLTIILVLSFVPALFLTRVVPEGQETISAPTAVVFAIAPIVSAWLLLEVVQFVVAARRRGARELGSVAQANFYFLAWVAWVVSFLIVLYAAVGDVEWINFFYDLLPPFLRIALVTLAVLSFLKLVPVIFYKRHRPGH
jgi:hypothetical protein